jgi:periplasmic divalent cation tolerance protein
MDAAWLLYSTWPDEASALTAGRVLVEENLCACVNVLPGVSSIYRWEGEIGAATEAAMLVKTAQPDAARDRIAALHPYEQPVILSLPVHPTGSLPAALAWIATAGRQNPGPPVSN